MQGFGSNLRDLVFGKPDPRVLYREVDRVLREHLAKRPLVGEHTVRATHPEPSAIDRLAAVVDPAARERVKDYEHDLSNGILRLDVSMPVQRAAPVFSIDIDLKPRETP